jgi:hypothetical protein
MELLNLTSAEVVEDLIYSGHKFNAIEISILLKKSHFKQLLLALNLDAIDEITLAEQIQSSELTESDINNLIEILLEANTTKNKQIALSLSKQPNITTIQTEVLSEILQAGNKQYYRLNKFSSASNGAELDIKKLIETRSYSKLLAKFIEKKEMLYTCLVERDKLDDFSSFVFSNSFPLYPSESDLKALFDLCQRSSNESLVKTNILILIRSGHFNLPDCFMNEEFAREIIAQDNGDKRIIRFIEKNPIRFIKEFSLEFKHNFVKNGSKKAAGLIQQLDNELCSELFNIKEQLQRISLEDSVVIYFSDKETIRHLDFLYRHSFISMIEKNKEKQYSVVKITDDGLILLNSPSNIFNDRIVQLLS